MIDLVVPSNAIISGSTRSGKTYLLKKLLKDQILKKIDYLIILSPTANLTSDWDEPEFRENDKEEKGLVVQKFHKVADFQTIIEEIVEQQTAIIEHNEDKAKKDQYLPQVFIVIDDSIYQKILSYKGIVDKLSIRSRHLNISLWVLVQKLKGIPRSFRVNSRYCFVFNSSNYSELEAFTEEFCAKEMRKNLRRQLQDIFNESYNYILCDCFSTKLCDRLYLNGKELLYDRLKDKPKTEEKE